MPSDCVLPKEEAFKNYIENRYETLIASGSSKKISIKEVLCAADYARSTWVCFFLGIFN